MQRDFKLVIQPVPKNNWGDTLAHTLPKIVWDELRKAVYTRADNKCEICTDILTTLHCHENWVFNDKLKTQLMQSLMAICRECHNTIHWYRSQVMAAKRSSTKIYPAILRDHFMKVNGCSSGDFVRYMNECDRVKRLRGKHNYEISYGRFSVDRIIERYTRKYGTVNVSST